MTVEPYADILILGSGIAGHSAAEAARHAAPEASITMVSREESCLRPLLSKAGFRRIGEKALAMDREDWLERNGIRFVKAEILELCREDRCIRTDRGTFRYGKCIYALGSQAFVPPIPGVKLPGVHAVRTLADVAAIKRSLPAVKQAVIIGGGVIGIEAGEMLARFGIGVTILESLPWLLPRVLDRDTAEEYRGRLTHCRVETGITVKCIASEASVQAVELADGRSFPCQTVIVSCGVRSDSALAARAGLEVQRGVVVDAAMQTSDPHIYACGDCAQFAGQCPALWKVAIDQGITAGENACGGSARYRAKAEPVLFYSPGASLFAMGQLTLAEGEQGRVEVQCWDCDAPLRITPQKERGYGRFVYNGNDRLMGAALIGDLTAMQDLRRRITGEVE